MQSQLLAQLLLAKTGMKANPPQNIPLAAENNKIDGKPTGSANIDKKISDNIRLISPTTTSATDVSLAPKKFAPSSSISEKDEISKLIERQERKYVKLLDEVEKRMDEKLAKLQLLVENRFNELERRLNNNNNNNNNSGNNNNNHSDNNNDNN